MVWQYAGTMNKQAVKHIIDSLGADAICDAIGVGKHSVRFARNAGEFSASWRGVLKALCDEKFIACPDDAFRWKPSQREPARRQRRLTAQAEAE